MMELDFVWLLSVYMGEDEGGDTWRNWGGEGLAICQRVVFCAEQGSQVIGQSRVELR